MDDMLLPKVKGTGSLGPKSMSTTAFRCGVLSVDKGSISGEGSEPSWSKFNASLKLLLFSASASETTRSICKIPES